MREDVRLLAIVTGSSGRTKRANEVQALLQYGYGAYDGMRVYSPGDEIKSLKLWMADTSEASIGVNQTLGIIFPKGKSDKLSAALELPDSLEAPIEAGTQVGHIQVKYGGEPVYRTTLHVNQTYSEGPWHMQLLDTLKRMIF